MGKSWLNQDKKILVGQNTMMVIFVDLIYIIALPIQQVFPNKNIWQNALLWCPFRAKGGKFAKM